jgi:hypothetical protein
MGEGPAATLAALSAAATTLLMLHFLRRLARAESGVAGVRAPAGLLAPWLATATAALAVPWLLGPSLAGVGLADTLARAELWAAIWPIALGVAGAFAMDRVAHALPSVPEGDVVVLGAGASAAARRCADALERADEKLRAWPVSGVALLTLALALGVAMLAGR